MEPRPAQQQIRPKRDRTKNNSLGSIVISSFRTPTNSSPTQDLLGRRVLPSVLPEVAEVKEDKSENRREEKKRGLELPAEELPSRNVAACVSSGFASARESIGTSGTKALISSKGENGRSMLSFKKLQELQNKLHEAAESGYRGSIWARNYFHQSKSVESKVKAKCRPRKEEQGLPANGAIPNVPAGDAGYIGRAKENYIQKNINNVNKHGAMLRHRVAIDPAPTQRCGNHQ